MGKGYDLYKCFTIKPIKRKSHLSDQHWWSEYRGGCPSGRFSPLYRTVLFHSDSWEGMSCPASLNWNMCFTLSEGRGPKSWPQILLEEVSVELEHTVGWPDFQNYKLGRLNLTKNERSTYPHWWLLAFYFRKCKTSNNWTSIFKIRKFFRNCFCATFLSKQYCIFERHFTYRLDF